MLLHSFFFSSLLAATTFATPVRRQFGFDPGEPGNATFDETIEGTSCNFRNPVNPGGPLALVSRTSGFVPGDVCKGLASISHVIGSNTQNVVLATMVGFCKEDECPGQNDVKVNEAAFNGLGTEVSPGSDNVVLKSIVVHKVV